MGIIVQDETRGTSSMWNGEETYDYYNDGRRERERDDNDEGTRCNFRLHALCVIVDSQSEGIWVHIFKKGFKIVFM